MSPPSDTTEARPSRLAVVVQFGLLAAALAGVILTAGSASWDAGPLIVLAISAAVGDLVGVDIPSTKIGLSGSLLAMVVAMVLLGGPPAACVGVVVVVVGWFRWREKPHALLNNLLAFALFPLLTGWGFAAARDAFGPGTDDPGYYLLVAAAFFVALSLNFAIVAGYQSYVRRASFWTEVRTALLPVLASDALSAVLAGVTIYLYRQVGLSGLALVTVVVITFQYLIGELLLSRDRARRLEQQAVTDELTGLGNRRRLLGDIESIVGGGAARALVLFDLDGFKQYNDIRGHIAGDELLARLAAALRTAASTAGVAYRLGGDEFCALVEGEGVELDRIVGRCAAALTAEDGGLLVGTSFGVVLLPAEADNASDALRIADRRMYAQKDSRPASAQGQARDVLLQVLSEREPDLHEHVNDVAALATGLAHRLGLDAMELSDVARAAELHDIGKLALPEEMLSKPGPLWKSEWELMRHHTIIGERMLKVAPSLQRVATYVRASHERWDGRGYPDGLAGEEIPLAARIIAVCDAYHAIRTDRPYRDGTTASEALAELRRCAGEQFDARVVEALAEEIAPEITAEAMAEQRGLGAGDALAPTAD
jgi:diguanylate cyclase (GGDEF)-like protein